MSARPAGPARVQAQGWGWTHAGRRRAAVHDLDLVVEPGQRVLLLGPSGSGKSTLLHGLAGVLGGEEEGSVRGRLLIDGVDAAAARGRAGLVLQDPEAQTVMARLGDDVAFGCENLGVPRQEIWPRVDEALRRVGLDRLGREHDTGALSGGQRQRLALAGVLAMRPGLLLLDEPTANLDPGGVQEVRDAVARVLEATGSTLVVVEHRVETWLPVVDRVVVLGRDGGLLADGDPQRVLRDEAGELSAAGVWLPGAPVRREPSAVGTAEPLLQARELGIARQPAALVREGIELEVASGRLLAVTGPNGTGKSTLALTLGGLLPPAGGRLAATPALRGQARFAEPVRWRSRELLSRIGSVFQNPEHQFLRGTVRAELEVGPRALGVGEGQRQARTEELLAALRLEHLAEANPFTLSGGEKRRLSVAAALATRPALLVLDEPTFGQDARSWAELVRLIAAIRAEGVGFVAVTHDQAFVHALADDELALDAPERGRLAA